MPAPPEACLTCGTTVEPGQEYCLECGARVVPTRRFSAVGRAWERRWGRYPGDWMWVALLLGLVAAGSATAGIVAARDTGTASGSRTLIATSPVVPAPPAPPLPTTTTTHATKAAPRPKPTPKPPNALTAWPARDGYTIVLASIPARGSGLAEATAKAKQALSGGSRVVGVLDSSKFASLHPGYYVVYAGIYDSLDEAQTAARGLSGRYPNAYARQVTR
jgi:hypothetical protein